MEVPTEFLNASITIPQKSTRCDFGFALGHWTNWCIVELKWYVGRGDTIEQANADMLMKFHNKSSLGSVKLFTPRVKELDGRTKEGKAWNKKDLRETTDEELKDIF